MLKSIRRNWHKAQALSVLQNYCELPFCEPLLAPIDTRLKELSEQSLASGGTHFDTALTYYAEFGRRALEDGRSLSDINFSQVFIRLWTLRPKLKFYPDHLHRITELGKSRAN